MKTDYFVQMLSQSQLTKIKNFYRLAKSIFNSFEKHNCREKAASLTYTSTLSLVPFLTVFLVILSSIPSLSNARSKITQWVYGNVLPETGLKISSYLDSFAEKSSNLTLIGILVLFITTVMMLAKIETVFNDIWEIKLKQAGLLNLSIADISRYWLMITIVPILLATAFIMSSTVASIDFLNKQLAGYSINWQAGLELLSVAMTIFGLASIFWLVLKNKFPFKYALIAGTFIGIIFEVLKNLFGYIVVNFTSYQIIYGAFASLPLLLLWIYLSWCLILLGVEISCLFYNNSLNKRLGLNDIELSYNNSHHETPKNNNTTDFIVCFSVLSALQDAQHRGTSLNTKTLLNTTIIHNTNQWNRIKNKLETANIITQDINEKWILKKNLESLTIEDLLSIFDLLLPTLRIKDGNHMIQLNEAIQNLNQNNQTFLNQNILQLIDKK